jgi:thiamine-phosphate pyrophosphorylase
MFGEPDETGLRPAFAAVEDRIAWWAEVFEAPCVGYAADPAEAAKLVAAGADFVALGDWLWRDPPAIPAQLADLARDLRLPEHAT